MLHTVIIVASRKNRKEPASWPCLRQQMVLKAGAAPRGYTPGGVRRYAPVTDAVPKRPHYEKNRTAAAAGPPVRASMVSRRTHFTMPTSARTGGSLSVPPACRTVGSPCEGARSEVPQANRATGYSRCPEGETHEEEAGPVQGDAADARREGTVPGRRRKPKWLQPAAERRAKQLPEHQGVGLLLTRTRNTGCQ